MLSHYRCAPEALAPPNPPCALHLRSSRLPSLRMHVLSRYTVVSLWGNERDREGFQSLRGEIKEEVGLNVAVVGRNRYRPRCAMRSQSSSAEYLLRRGRRRQKDSGDDDVVGVSALHGVLSFFTQADLCTSAISFMLSFTDLVPLRPLLADTFSSGPAAGLTGTGNKHGSLASACYVKEQVHIDAYGILSPIDLPSAFHIYTF